MFRPTNRGSNLTEPEIWFRIVHITPKTPGFAAGGHGPRTNGRDRPGAQGDLRERQHRHPDAPGARRPGGRRCPRCLGKPKRPLEPKTLRVAELLRKVIEWRAPLMSGEVSNHAGIARARVSQILGLLRLVRIQPNVDHKRR